MNPADQHALREALAENERLRVEIELLGQENENLEQEAEDAVAFEARALAAEAENTRLKETVEGARTTNRSLHRRLQTAEGETLSRAVKAERAAEFWLTRRKASSRMIYAHMRTNEALRIENTRLKETVEGAATRFEDIAAGRAFQPRLHAATGATEARSVLATIPPKENPDA